MNQGDLQVTKQLRKEIIERIRLRTQINWFKMAALGALLAWNQPKIASWIMPFVAISFDFSILHNAIYIHQIGDFIAGYKWWHDFEWRVAQLRWKRIPIDLLTDRLSYIIITLGAVIYSILNLKTQSTQPVWLKCIWFKLIVVLLGIECWMLILSLIRWQREPKSRNK